MCNRRQAILVFFDACHQCIDRVVRAAVGSASRTARRGRVVIQTFRGYGSARHIFLMGRVLREASPEAPCGQSIWQRLMSIWRLMRAWGIEDAKIRAQFGDTKTDVRTDKDGYFRLQLDLQTPPPEDRLWHQVALCLDEPVAINVVGHVFIPPDSCGFVVISDIDDTIMHTDVANKALMMWRLFMQEATGRNVIPGMAPFLRALHSGPARSSANPMLYVSRAPWAIYGVLERFFNLHDIPNGPILFLREWGLTLQHPLPRRGRNHKRDLIRQIILHYDDLPIILIGDSGQHDPQIYADIVESFPNRVLAVYIRDVGQNSKRDRAVSQISAGLESNGGSLVLTSDILAMAKHAAELGLIDMVAVDDIEAELGSTEDPRQ